MKRPALSPAIEDLVPHAGPMCLLARVRHWDAESIHCDAVIDSGDDHPLAIAGRLPATALIEYAAQAMAAHGRLVASAPAGSAPVAGRPAADNAAGPGPRPGRLAGLRAIHLACRWVTCNALDVRVQRLGGDDDSVLYDFTVHPGPATAADTSPPLASGRAVVILAPSS